MEENKKQNYLSSSFENFYVAINPNIEIDEMGYVWQNSNSEERDNAYPNMLIDLYKNASSIHSNFINLKANLIYGSQGLVAMDKNNEATKQAINTANRAGETLDDVFKKMAMDFAILESAAVQLIYNANGNIAEIYHISPSYIRSAVNNEFGYVERYLVNENWGIVSNKRNRRAANMISKSTPVAYFNPATGVEDQRQILFIKKYTTGNDYYSVPSYNSAIPYIKLDHELAKFHLSKVDNSFSPTAMISLYGNPDDEQKRKFVRDFKMKHTGSDNAGNLLFMWTDGENQEPKITRLEGDTQKGVFEELNSIVNQSIAAGHGASIDLAGISDAGASLGGDANKLNVSRSSFIDNVIIGYQNILLQSINKILKVNNIGEVTVVNDPLKLTQPLAQAEDLTRDERRSILYGLPPLDNVEDNVDDNGVAIVNPNKVDANGMPATEVPFNSNLAGMSGKQYINMNRILRNINSGKLTREAGTALLKASFGFDDELIMSLLDPSTDTIA